MSIEKDLLVRAKVLIECLDTSILQDQADIIFSEIKELLAQPEQEQEPVVKITSIHADGENLPVVITGVVLSDAVNIWDLPIKNNDLLFLAPPRREPLSDKEITKNTPKLIHIGERVAFHAGVRFAERHHIIGVNDDT